MNNLQIITLGILMCLFCFITSAGSEEPVNLLTNSGFESGGTPPTGWQIQQGSIPEIAVSMDTTLAHNGSRSFKVKNAASAGWDEAAIHTYNTPIPSGLLFYDLSFWTRLTNANRVRACIYWRDENKDLIGNGSSDIIVEYTGQPMTHDWEEQSVVHVQAPPNAVAADVYLYAQGPGEFWFDDVLFRFHKPAPVPVFPDLTADSMLDRNDFLSLAKYFRPEEKGFTEFDIGDLLGFLNGFESRGAIEPGLSFRDFFPLNDGDDYYYRSDDFPNNIDWFAKKTTGPITVHGRSAYILQVYDTPPEDVAGRQSLVASATGPFEFLQIIIDTEIFDETTGLTFPKQTIDLNPGLVLAFENVEVGDVETTTAAGTIDVKYGDVAVNGIPVTLTLDSIVSDVGQTVILQDDGSTETADTLVVTNQTGISGTIVVPFPPTTIPLNVYFKPGSFIMWLVRGVGMVQLQEFTDRNTPGEIFPLRRATIAGETYP